MWVRASERVLNFLLFSLYLLILFFFVTFHWCWFGNCCYFMFCLCCRRHSWPTFCSGVCGTWERARNHHRYQAKEWNECSLAAAAAADGGSCCLLLIESIPICIWIFWCKVMCGVYGEHYGWLYGAMYAWTTIIIYIPILFHVYHFNRCCYSGQRERKYMPHWIKCIYVRNLHSGSAVSLSHFPFAIDPSSGNMLLRLLLFTASFIH